jgi:hypothetical protein
MGKTEEQRRLDDAADRGLPWKKWGPYLSERQWGTVREDYSAGGDAWSYFSHEQSRARAYRWGDDGLGGLCDDWSGTVAKLIQLFAYLTPEAALRTRNMHPGMSSYAPAESE